jgi:hypothetical protein
MSSLGVGDSVMSSTRAEYTVYVNLEVMERPNWDYLRVTRLRRVLTWHVNISVFG